MELEEIKKLVSKFTKIPISKFEGRSKKKNICYARHLYCKLAIEEGYTLYKVGAEMGRRNNATVINSCKKVENEIELNNLYKKLKDEIYSDRP